MSVPCKSALLLLSTDLVQKTPFPAERDDFKFVAGEDWKEEDESVSSLLQRFGSYTIHDDVLHDLVKSGVNCFSSVVSNSVVSSSIVQSSDDADGVIYKSSTQRSRETCASLGLFSQIFIR